MRLIQMMRPQVWRQESGYEGLCEHIARCASICYRSQPKEGGDAVDFVRRLVKMGHGRALEFGTVRLRNLVESDLSGCREMWSYVHVDADGGVWASLRSALRIIGSLDDIEAAGDSMTEDMGQSPRVTVHYPAIARSIADEFRTHTTVSTLMRSTRYVDANTRGEINCVIPSFLNECTLGDERVEVFIRAMAAAEDAYNALINAGFKRQDAREVLPLCVATEMVQCGVVGQADTGWDNLIRFRTAKTAHPDAQAVARMVREELIENGTRLQFNTKEDATLG